MKEEALGGGVYISELEYFSTEQIFDCGQSFRFRLSRAKRSELSLMTELSRESVDLIRSSCSEEFPRADGIAFGRRITVLQPTPSTLLIFPCTYTEYLEIWKHYLALDADYAAIRRELQDLRPSDATLIQAMETGKGIRILRQDPWETLCTFMISQNNNIPRITGLVDALCRTAGEPLPDLSPSGEHIYAFPTPDAVCKLGVDGLLSLKMGFRAPYLFDAATKLSSGEIELDTLRGLTTEDASRVLRNIKGVGPKVAACSLLFGLEKDDAFPIDVWVKRVMTEYYPTGILPSAFGAHAGLAQQYLFYYKRYRDVPDV